MDRATAFQPRSNQIPYHLMLAIDGDGLAGEVFEIDAMAMPGKTELNPVMHQPLPAHPIAHTDLIQQIDRAVLQHSGPNPVFAILPAAILHNHRLDAFAAK